MYNATARGFTAILLTAVIYGFFGVLIKLLSESFGTNFQVAVRGFSAAALAFAIVLYKRQRFTLPRGVFWPMLIFLVAFPLSLVCFTASVQYTKATNSLFMLYAGSLTATYLAGLIFFKERPTRQRLLALGLVVIGLYIFVYPLDLRTINAGIYLGVAAGLLEGSVHAARKALQAIPREVLLTLQYAATGVIGLALSFAFDDAMIKQFSPAAAVTVVLFGAALVAIGWLLLYGFKHYDVNAGTIVLASELFFATGINYWLLDEVPTRTELIGGVVIFMAAVLMSVKYPKSTNFV